MLLLKTESQDFIEQHLYLHFNRLNGKKQGRLTESDMDFGQLMNRAWYKIEIATFSVCMMQNGKL